MKENTYLQRESSYKDTLLKHTGRRMPGKSQNIWLIYYKVKLERFRRGS